MSSRTHTKGPYYATVGSMGQSQISSQSDPKGRTLAVVYNPDDATVMAGAPQLLEALDECVTELDQTKSWSPDRLRRRLRAINKTISEVLSQTDLY